MIKTWLTDHVETGEVNGIQHQLYLKSSVFHTKLNGYPQINTGWALSIKLSRLVEQSTENKIITSQGNIILSLTWFPYLRRG